MSRYAAFLRAVNLGSTRQVKSAELRACLEGAGFEDVASFRTSGNVVLTDPRGGGAEKARARIETALEREFGFEVPTFVRTAAQVRAIAAEEPFPPKAVASSKGKVQVVLLNAKPLKRERDAVLALPTDEDLLAFGASELYWLPSGGTQKSSLDLKAVDRAVGPGTTRTMGTIERLAAKFFDSAQRR